jgi:hypothetical protein
LKGEDCLKIGEQKTCVSDELGLGFIFQTFHGKIFLLAKDIKHFLYNYLNLFPFR